MVNVKAKCWGLRNFYKHSYAETQLLLCSSYPLLQNIGIKIIFYSWNVGGKNSFSICFELNKIKRWVVLSGNLGDPCAARIRNGAHLVNPSPVLGVHVSKSLKYGGTGRHWRFSIASFPSHKNRAREAELLKYSYNDPMYWMLYSKLCTANLCT